MFHNRRQLIAVSRRPFVAAAGGSNTFVTDALTGAASYWGMRAYTNSTKAAMDLVRDDAATTTINAQSTGGLDMSTLNTFMSGHTAKISKLYDQISTRHAVQTTDANRPTLELSVSGGKPSIRFTASGSQRLILPNGCFNDPGDTPPGPGIIPQPMTMNCVCRAATSGPHSVAGVTALLQISSGTADTAGIYAGTSVATVSATEGVFHSLNGIFNGANSFANADGISGSTANAGSVGMPVGADCNFGTDAFGNFHDGHWSEFVLYSSALNSTQCSSLSTNQHAYWGF